ncbi:MAG: hypothetical protein AAGH88_14510 [Planctomycetota bacterium]
MLTNFSRLSRLLILAFLFFGLAILPACGGGEEAEGPGDAQGDSATSGDQTSSESDPSSEEQQPAEGGEANLVNDLVKAFGEIPVVLEEVKDVPSANIAAEKLGGIKTRLNGYLDIYKFLGLAEQAEASGLNPQLSGALEQMEASVGEQMERIQADHPEAMPVIIDSLGQLKNIINQLEGDPR